MNSKAYIFWLTIVVGFFLRMVAASVGYNYDMESWDIVSNLVLENKNVYAHTGRYNYGYLWAYLLGALKYLSIKIAHFGGWDVFSVFRFSLAIFLTFVDAIIAFLLFKNFNLKASVLYFLCPITIIISGFYTQFESLSLLFAFLFFLHYDKKDKFYLSLCFLGLSIIIKHVFIFYPIWLFFREKELKRKMLILLIPIGLFALGFLPYLNEGWEGIYNNVLKYRAFNNKPLLWLIAPDVIYNELNWFRIFIVILPLLGYLYRKKSNIENFVFYTFWVIILSSSLSDSHIALPVLGMSIFFNLPFAVYFIVVGFYQTLSLDGLNLDYGFYDISVWLKAEICRYPRIYSVAVFLIIFGIFWKDFVSFLSRIKSKLLV